VGPSPGHRARPPCVRGVGVTARGAFLWLTLERGRIMLVYFPSILLLLVVPPPTCQPDLCQICVKTNVSHGTCCNTSSVCKYDEVFSQNVCMPPTPWLCNGSPSPPWSARCDSAMSKLSAAPSYQQLVSTVANAWANSVKARTANACETRARPCPWDPAAGRCTCMNQSAYSWPYNATACLQNALSFWEPFAYVVRALEREGNETLASDGDGGRNYWLNPAVATVSGVGDSPRSTTRSVTFESFTLYRPFYLPDACSDAQDMHALVSHLDATCRTNRSDVLYCNVGVQWYPNP
jgi:hypothetical protein